MYGYLLAGLLFYLLPASVCIKIIQFCFGVEIFILLPLQIHFNEYRQLLSFSEWLVWGSKTDVEQALMILRVNNPECMAHVEAGNPSNSSNTASLLSALHIAPPACAPRNILPRTNSMVSLAQPGKQAKDTVNNHAALPVISVPPDNGHGDVSESDTDQEGYRSGGTDHLHSVDRPLPSDVASILSGYQSEATSTRLKRKAGKIKDKVHDIFSSRKILRWKRDKGVKPADSSSAPDQQWQQHQQQAAEERDMDTPSWQGTPTTSPNTAVTMGQDPSLTHQRSFHG
ncbi:hypothetical protein EV182_002974, partial [Spiromyces aspiralis]